ncbi:glyoxal reductase isoform X3 [Halyomorpha halys]|uniref:glyoxal reductase isoform X3 n=1 Tax=Halyomorpha halys TaxID=286706 RepID=UPI0034D31675
MEEEEEEVDEQSYDGTRNSLKPFRKVKDTKITLNNGIQMPVLGYTASNYYNERDIGTSMAAHLPDNNLERDDVFIISKLATQDQCGTNVRKAVLKSMKNLMMEQIDLYLVHWPGGSIADIPDDESPKHRSVRHDTWQQLVRLLEEEKLRSIGVSNFCARHLGDLLDFSSVKPVVNQVEFHPHYRQPQELIDLCKEQDIFLQAYGLFGGGENAVLFDPVIIEVLTAIRRRIHYLSTAQVILRWGLQSGFGVLTKAMDYTPIHLNADLDFYITKRQMNQINAISTRRKYYWDPEAILH